MNLIMMQAVCNIVNRSKKPSDEWIVRVGNDPAQIEFFFPRDAKVAETVNDENKFLHFATLMLADEANRIAAKNDPSGFTHTPPSESGAEPRNVQ